MITQPVAPPWNGHPRRNDARAAELARALGAPLPVAQVLVNRGIGSLEAARSYLDPSGEDLHDPFRMRDMDRAVERVERAIKAGERVMVHGDYDVDGITATFVLYSALLQLGARAEYRIPHRTRDGYGLSPDAMDDAHRRGCTLVVTVDCGITAVEAVERGRVLGIDTVITDHHEPPAALPAAVAVVDPLRPGCEYPFKALPAWAWPTSSPKRCCASAARASARTSISTRWHSAPLRMWSRWWARIACSPGSGSTG